MEARRLSDVHYPDSDGLPMAENTLQFRWIVTLKENLDALLPEAFVAGDLLWYPVQGQPKIRIGPDVLVAFGRPKGDRGSYRQWEEGGVVPQVVFEVMSPGNTTPEMADKTMFYDRHGVEEFYLWDPDRIDLAGWIRSGDALLRIANMNGWKSPRLGITFRLADDLVVEGPDGARFLTFGEVLARAEGALRRAEGEAKRADDEAKRADDEAKRADDERTRADRLAARLRELGIAPE